MSAGAPPRRQWVPAILASLLGIVFLFSAVSKLPALKTFTWSILDVLPIGELWAGIVARVLIGIELLLGGFLVGQLALRRFTLPAAAILLLAFSAYLLLSILKTGNAGNCGCFGNWLKMSPGAALLKNIGMLALIAVLWRLRYDPAYKGAFYVGALFVAASLTIPFVLRPVYINGEEEFVREKIPLDLLYQDPAQHPSVELRKGRHVVAFFSLTCPHCKSAARRLEGFLQKDPNLPIYAILTGDSSQLQNFLAESEVRKLPWFLFRDQAAFQKMAGEYVPQIFWITDGISLRKSYYAELNLDEIQDWAGKP